MGLPSSPKMTWEGRERRLAWGFFVVVIIYKGGAGVRVSPHSRGSHGWNLPPAPKEKIGAFKSACPVLGCKGQREGWGRKLSANIQKWSLVQSLSRVRLFVTPWTAARQASLSITSSWRLLRLMSIESVMPSSHLILCHPLLLLPSIFPSIKVFSKESVLHIRCQSIGVSASASVLPMNIQDWFPLGLMGWISLQSKAFPTSQFKSIDSLVLSFLYGPTLISIHDYWNNHSFD